MAFTVNATLGVVLFLFFVGHVNGSKHLHVKHYLPRNEKCFLNFTELSNRDGLVPEEHQVVTEDGYILTVFRLRKRECVQLKTPPVVLMHGLFQSSDSWLDAGPRAGLAYLITGACHDLWIGNQRGTCYSRRHLHLDPDKDAKFWQFSMDEIGLFDIPATVDYILNNTGEEKLNYIGYSQGAGAFFVMCSERPGYCNKANVLITLAPATRLTNTKSVVFKEIAQFVNEFEEALTLSGIHELFYKGSFVQRAFVSLCKLKASSVCGALLSLVDVFHPGSVDTNSLLIIASHTPSGTSAHNLARYGQATRTKKFQKFDYGTERNLQKYGQKLPPSYNLTAVTAPTVVLYGRNDNLVDPKDVSWLVSKLPNVLEAREVDDPLWNHLDMTYSQHVKTMLFPKVDYYLHKYS